jgi:hypothetical protein
MDQRLWEVEEEEEAPADAGEVGRRWPEEGGDGVGVREPGGLQIDNDHVGSRGQLKKRSQHSTSRSMRSGRERPACRTIDRDRFCDSLHSPARKRLTSVQNCVRNQRRTTTGGGGSCNLLRAGELLRACVSIDLSLHCHS